MLLCLQACYCPPRRDSRPAHADFFRRPLWLILDRSASVAWLSPSRLASSRQTCRLGIVAEQPAEGRFVEVDGGFMVPYTETIPGTDVTFEMIPVPGGEFLLGSPEAEADRSDDEGPQVRVRVAPFWIGKCEVTWAEYQAYMEMYDVVQEVAALAADAGRPSRTTRPTRRLAS